MFLVGLGIVWVLGVLWPGVLVVFGIVWSASLFMQKQFWATMVVATFLCAIPLADLIWEASDALIASLVIGVGTVGLARAVYLWRVNKTN